jgi:hypothetical protein
MFPRAEKVEVNQENENSAFVFLIGQFLAWGDHNQPPFYYFPIDNSATMTGPQAVSTMLPTA